MWMSKEAYLKLVEENAQLRGANREQARQLTFLQTTLDWLRVRVTQVEKERAQLLYNYMGIKVEVPEIAPAAQTMPSAGDLARAIAPYFTDMGDEEAAKQGIGWNESGELVYPNAQKS